MLKDKLSPNVETFLCCDGSYDDAGLVLFGAPFDSTTSNRPGTRFGPRAIRSESFGIESYSPYQDRDILDVDIFDSGDIELPFGDTERALGAIEKRTGIILADEKKPLMFGGEHLVTLGAVRAMAQKYPDLHIIHFDAHADLRDEYLDCKLSHASVLRRCHDLLGDGRIFQFGIRSGDRTEFLWAEGGHVKTRLFDFHGLRETVEALREYPLYLTIDMDVLDPSVFPGTGTPEAGGVTFVELLGATLLACSGQNVVGADLVELAPAYDASGISTATACKLARELMLAML